MYFATRVSANGNDLVVLRLRSGRCMQTCGGGILVIIALSESADATARSSKSKPAVEILFRGRQAVTRTFRS